MAFHMQDSNILLRKTCTDETWAQPALVKRTSVSRAVILLVENATLTIQLIFSSTAPQGLAFLDKAWQLFSFRSKNFNSFPIQTIRNVDGFFVSSQRLNCGAIFLCFRMFNGVSRSKETYKMKK
ncbi:hypothetical protein E2320_014680 [Naja naja]|nr:hypothetical protein E2320_014680 [Naja naja]